MRSVKPGKLEGTVIAAASKSDAQRAIAAAALCHGTSVLDGYSTCDDTQTALNLARSFGATTIVDGGMLSITGDPQPPRTVLNCGESGLALRLFASIASLFPDPTTLHGIGTLTRRPVQPLVDALRQFGARCESANGFLPLTTAGPLASGVASIDGFTSSQHVSGLMFALPLAQGESRLSLRQATSIPYLQMTRHVLAAFGIEVQANPSWSRIEIEGRQVYRPARYLIEGDWSGAAFVLVAGAITGRVTVQNVRADSLQADRAILDILRQCGATVTQSESSATVSHSTLRAFRYDARHCPDLFPPLTALACFCKGTSIIEGTHRLAGKESDRASTLLDQFRAMGAKIFHRHDCLQITGGPLRGGAVDTHHDHRIAMAVSVAALRSEMGVTLNDDACVSKSYPEFFNHLRHLGAQA